MRLVCDEMLRGLARWLRAAGHDTVVPASGESDNDVLARALATDRLLLTRDREFWERTEKGRGILLSGGSIEEWVDELNRELDLDWLWQPFSRCLLCNRPLEPVADSGTAAEERRCNHCRKRYWEGSHTRRMRRQLRRFQAMRRDKV